MSMFAVIWANRPHLYAFFAIYIQTKYRMAKFRIAKQYRANKKYKLYEFVIYNLQQSAIYVYISMYTVYNIQYLMRSFGETVKLIAQLRICACLNATILPKQALLIVRPAIFSKQFYPKIRTEKLVVVFVS